MNIMVIHNIIKYYYYIDNIIKLINNNQLIETLEKKNISLYFTVHHKFRQLVDKFKQVNLLNILMKKIFLNAYQKQI